MEIYNKLFEILNSDDLLLTANKRLIPFLHKAYAHYQQTQKKLLWPTLSLFTLSRWLELLWEKQQLEQQSFPFRLLTEQQEYVIWQGIINKSCYLLLDTQDTAQSAQQAWQLLHQAQLNYKSSHFKHNKETASWQSWASTFAEFSNAHHYIDPSSATNLLTELLQKKILTPPKRIFMLGFTELNRQTRKLLDCLAEQGCIISHYAPAYSKPKLQRLSLIDKETEFRSMALWAYQCEQAGQKNIACIVPNLIQQRSQLLNQFNEVFTALTQTGLHPPPFNMAAGNPLKEFALIQTAITIIELENINSFSQVSGLIRSPYLGASQQEQSQRAQLDIYLRCHSESKLSLAVLVATSKKQACPHLSGLISQLMPLLKEYDSQSFAKPSLWAEHFAKKLHSLAWPGERHLSSDEFQLLERWSKLLTELASLDFILGPISHARALQQLKELIANGLFQAKTRHDPPIQILGILDSAGIYFDAMWVMGLDDKTWPTAAKPNPFIPYSLQRQHQLPHASNERELYFARLLTEGLIRSAPRIIFSHAAQNLDHVLRPSLLINAMQSIELSELALPHYQSRTEKIRATQDWEYYSDEQGPALPGDQYFPATSQLLQSQANCPFQAFARFRLNAKFYPLPQIGLNARDRGILLHQILEQFWNMIVHQEALLQLSAVTLEQQIDAAIDFAIVTYTQKRPFVFKSHFIDIERRRLRQLLKNIVDVEKQRPLFIQSLHEQKQNYTLGKLKLNLRIDRIDQLEDNSYLIIDYKTGVPTTINYLEERLDHLQLPLYCLAYAETVRGFALMHIRSHIIRLQGITAEETGITQLKPLKKLKTTSALQSWSDLLHHWHTLLEKLAQQFQAGVAAVDPKRGSATCQQCDLKLLCRINH
jgi:probable DNA repair protein